MSRIARNRQGGMALVAALFLMVVLASLGIWLLRSNTTQQQAANLHLLGLRAQSAAHAGVEYATNRALRAGTCNATTLLNPAALPGFTVNVRCTPSNNHSVNGTLYTLYVIDADAWRGTYGSPDYVWRSASRTVSAVP